MKGFEEPTDVLARDARELSNRLFKGGCERGTEGRQRPCLEQKGGFQTFREHWMCLPCAAYWHAERAAQLLEDRIRWDSVRAVAP